MKGILLGLLFISGICRAQKWQLEANGGFTGYSGDLTRSDLTTKTWSGAFGLAVKYQLTPMIAARAGILAGHVHASDKDNVDSNYLKRNLSFETNILEGSFCLEFNILSPDLFDVYPYVFAGVGFFHFNPYAYDNSGQKVYLAPLSTEGEGLPQYPNRPVYALTQFCIPFGFGAKKQLGPNMDIGIEVGYRKTFTDYLDDVSKRYADPAILLAARGQEAVDMSFRGTKDRQYNNGIRGNPDKNDIYYNVSFKYCYYFGGRMPGYNNPQPERYKF
jgi:hypothetical protein